VGRSITWMMILTLLETIIRTPSDVTFTY
jgi:hypothetical protein